MAQEIIKFLNRLFAPELVTVIVAALPISELRGSIPLALGVFHFSIEKAYFLSIIGNLIPVIPLLLFLESLSKWLSMRFNWAEKFFSWLFARTKKRSKLVEKYGAIGLIFFVAIPLPVTGAWTGCVAAFLFGIRRVWATLCIGNGVLIAGIIVTLASLGVIEIFW
ncbi:MAG: COG2426 family protein [bacterium]